MAVLKVEGISKTFTTKEGAHIAALQDLSLTVGAGEFVSII